MKTWKREGYIEGNGGDDKEGERSNNGKELLEGKQLKLGRKGCEVRRRG